MKTYLLLFGAVMLIFVMPIRSQTFDSFDTSSLEPISPSNAQQIHQLQIYGQGQPGEVAWSPDGTNLAVADTLGVWLYDSQDWEADPQLIATFDTIQTYWDASWGPLVEFSPNGELLAFSGGNSIRFWDVRQQSELTELEQSVYTSSIAFSPDGRQFVAGGFLQLVFWNTETWEIEKIWTSPQNDDYTRLGALAYSPDGKLLATNGSYRGNVQLWNPDAETFDEALIANLGETPFDDIVVDTEFSPDGGIVVSASLTFGAVRAFDVSTFEEIELETNGGSTIAFSPNGQLLATARTGVPHPGPYTGPTSVEVSQTNTYASAYTWEDHESVRFLSFSPTGEYLAAVSAFDGRVRILDVSVNTDVGTIHTALNARSLAISPDGQLIGIDTVAFSGTGLMEIATGEIPYQHQEIITELQIERGFTQSVFRSNGDFLVAQFTGDDVLLINQATDLIYRLDVAGRNVVFTFSDDGETLAANGEDLTIWSTSTGERLSEIETERLSLNQRPMISPDGQYVALIEGPDASGFLRVWDTFTGQVFTELDAFPVYAIAFHPNRDVVAIADRNSITVWNLQTGERIETFSPSGFIMSFNDTLTFLPDGNQLVFGSGTGTIDIWEWESSYLVQTLEAHNAVVNDVVVSSDGSIMVSSDINGNLAIWDYANLENLTSIMTRFVGIESIILSHNRDRLLVLYSDGVLGLWGVLSNE